jgi:hypothetical protein
MKVSTLTACGKQVMYRMRDDKTEVKSLVLPKTKKVAVLLANLANMSKGELFVLKPKGH